MIFGIELRPISLGASGGIAVQLTGVLNRLFRQFPADTFHVFTTLYSRGLLDARELSNVHFHTLPTRNFFGEMDRLIDVHQVVALFRAYPVSDDSRFPLFRQVVLIPDVQHEYRPEFFDPGVLRCRRAAFNRSLAHVGAIGTISSHARQEILGLPVTRCRDVFLMPPALTDAHQPVDESQLTADERALVPQTPFFYYPANLWIHKNHRRLLAALRLVLARTQLPLRLILTGHPDGLEELLADADDLPVTHLGFVRPQLVRLLLQRAVALAFFSQYEGFGIPLLEAFSAGCPVVCADTTSLPEVAGDAAIFADPSDERAMADAMIAVATRPEVRTELIARGRARLDLWTWEHSAANLRAALSRVAGNVAPASDGEPVSGRWRRRGLWARMRGLHRTYWHQKGFTIRRAWRELRRRVRTMLLGSSVLNSVAHYWPATARAIDKLQSVRGVRPDNTLAPVVRIVLHERLATATLRLGGVAAADATLRIFAGRSLVDTFALPGGQRQLLTFALPAGADRALTLRLSAGARFRLDETNLFCEDDLY